MCMMLRNIAKETMPGPDHNPLNTMLLTVWMQPWHVALVVVELRQVPVFGHFLNQNPSSAGSSWCTVSIWAPWSDCSASCGSGTMTRLRTVTAGNVLCPSTAQTNGCSAPACCMLLHSLLTVSKNGNLSRECADLLHKATR